MDEVFDHYRDARGAAVADDLFADGKRFADQVRLSRTRGRAVGAQLNEELVGIAALVKEPSGIQLGVAVGTRLTPISSAVRTARRR